MPADLAAARDEMGQECRACVADGGLCRCVVDCGSARCTGWADRQSPALPIGRDIDLLCDAVTAVAGSAFVSQRNLQRRIRVGFIKAQLLLLLMDAYGITDGPPQTRWSSRTVKVSKTDLPARLAELRDLAAREGSP
jgi:hypothetical protein